MPDDRENQDPREPDFGQAKHPEIDSAEALPISTGTKAAIKTFVDEKLLNLKPDPNFDNNIYYASEIDDPDYESVNIIWQTASSKYPEPNQLGYVALHLRNGGRARVKYNFNTSPDGLQVEKDVVSDWNDDVRGASTVEEVEERMAASDDRHAQALKDERQLGLTIPSEADGQQLLKLLTEANSWTTE